MQKCHLGATIFYSPTIALDRPINYLSKLSYRVQQTTISPVFCVGLLATPVMQQRQLFLQGPAVISG